MPNSRKDSKSNNDKANSSLCKECGKICQERIKCKKIDEISIQCDECEEWYHKGCIKVTDDQWKILDSASSSILFKCDHCVISKTKLSKDMTELKSEMSAMRTDMSNLAKIMAENNASLINQLETTLMPKIEAKIDQKIEEKFKELKESNEKSVEEKIELNLKQYKELNATNKNDQLDIEKSIRQHVSEEIEEMKEQEERKNNVIIFNVKETPSEREEESKAADLNNIKEILTFSNPELADQINDLNETSISRMGRLNADATKPRPIKLSVKNTKTKFQILKNSQKMKDCTSHTKIGFKKDLTKKQQQEESVLRAELEERKKAGDDVVIYKRKVISRSERDRIKATFKTRKNDPNRDSKKDDDKDSSKGQHA